VNKQPAASPLPEVLRQLLANRFGQRFSCGESTRLQHGRDESVHEPLLPDGVVMTESSEEVALVVRLCAEHGVPVIPYGVGSSVEGHVLAPGGGISLDLSGMNRIVAIHADDGDAVVEADVTRKQLNDALMGSGLFFPIDPGADATLGGRRRPAPRAPTPCATER
jgi:D-lactate dehydrogenase (cytochrome)